MTALSFYLEGERVARVEVEVGRREEPVRSLVMRVDHNNFLPCLTVSLAEEEEEGATRLQYRPV